MATIIDGKAVSAFLKDGIKKECLELKEKGVSVCLAVIIVGDDPASRTYVNNKKKGVRGRRYNLTRICFAGRYVYGGAARTYRRA